MATVYLHIGTPKTGTSFLQNFFQDNRAVLEKQGYVYPDFKMTFAGVGKARNGHFLAYKKEDAETVYQTAMELMIQEFCQKFDKIILSEEALWNYGVNIEKFVNDMKAQNHIVRIVVYLRRQDLYLQSKWAQNVKETAQNTFLEFVQKPSNVLDYYGRLCSLKDIVGVENMFVRVYEKQQFTGDTQDLRSDFFETVGLSWDEEFVLPEKVKNPSLAGVYLETKRKLNRYPEFATKLNFVVPYLYAAAEKNEGVASYSENKYFTYEQQMDFLKQYEESNAKVAKEFLGREDGILFKDEIVDNGEPLVDYSEDEYFGVLSEVIIMQNQKLLEEKELKAAKIQELKEKTKEAKDKTKEVKDKVKELKDKAQELKVTKAEKAAKEKELKAEKEKLLKTEKELKELKEKKENEIKELKEKLAKTEEARKKEKKDKEFWKERAEERFSAKVSRKVKKILKKIKFLICR